MQTEPRGSPMMQHGRQEREKAGMKGKRGNVEAGAFQNGWTGVLEGEKKEGG